MLVQSFVVLPHHGLFSRPLTNARVHSMDWQHGDWVLLGGDAGRGVKVLGVLQPPACCSCVTHGQFFKICAWSLPSPVWAPLVVCYNRCRLAWQKEHCCTGTAVVCTVSTVEAFPPHPDSSCKPLPQCLCFLSLYVCSVGQIPVCVLWGRPAVSGPCTRPSLRHRGVSSDDG